ncbi:oxygenase MpaB family protein [soil metagenome]
MEDETFSLYAREMVTAPTGLRRLAEARRRFGTLADTYVDAMQHGDPLADAFVADFADLGHGRALRMLRTACREGIDAVPDPPSSLRALVAALDDVPDWVDLDRIDHDSRFIARYTRQNGIVLGAASLVSGYANSAASRPLELTGRYLDDAGARTIEVASWLVAITRAGGLERHAEGFELTVRVRVIHALVRQALRDDPRWDHAAWGLPICQAYLAYTLVEFVLIPMRAVRMIGAPYRPHEERAAYARWHYVGHLLGIDPALLPADQAAQERLEELYLLTRPVVDDYCRDLVAAINRDVLAAEVEGLLPAPAHRFAPTVVHGLERLFLGDEIADDLAIPRTRVTAAVRALGPALGLVNGFLDRLPFTLAPRTRLGERYQVKQEARLRATYGVHHDLVDASPAGGRPHPARA